ncbi:ABC transporter permease [Actinocatenispora rupis]|uniref:ABC transporter permease n=1 Tax=Actinocatenispora rupis TaxID=519421 RepID=UPI00194387A3|nr:ABC transporter permease [Actinocatenispora rupis]
MSRALHAEWTKLRTLPGTGWLLLGTVAVTVAVGAAAAATVSCHTTTCGYDTPKLALSGVLAGQALAALLAVTAVTTEYGTGLATVTYAALPRRTGVLAARATVVAAVTAVAGTLGVAGSLLVARILLPRNGFTPVHGYPPLSLADGPTLRAATGTVLYLVLVALFALGVATAVRDTAAGVGLVAGVLYVLQIAPYVVGDPGWQRALWRLSPTNAGLTVQATRHLSHYPLGPWAGLGVLAAWSAAALLAGGLLLKYRDA